MLAFLLGLIALMAQILGPARLSWLANHINQLSSNPELASSATASYVTNLDAMAASLRGAGFEKLSANPNTGGHANPGPTSSAGAGWTNSGGTSGVAMAPSMPNPGIVNPQGSHPCAGGYEIGRGRAIICENYCACCGSVCARRLTVKKPFHNNHVCSQCNHQWNNRDV